MPKNILLKLNFQHDDHLYLNCLIYILTICCKCLLFQSLGCAILMQNPKRSSKRDILVAKKWSYFAQISSFEVSFQHKGQVDTIFLIYILIIYRESLRCQFFSRDIRTHTFCPNMSPKWAHKSPKK